MKRRRKPGYYTLLALAVSLAGGAVLTVMPVSYAYKDCMLGYRAHCTLTPVSTILCIVAAVITYKMAQSSFTEAS